MRTNTTRIKIRWSEFDRLCNARGWENDSERARKIGIDPSTLSNLRAGTYGPGSIVMHQILTVLKAPYPSLFEAEAPAEVS